MSTTTTVPIQVRVDAATKQAASEIFADLGTDMGHAINMFLKKCVDYGGIPFRLRRHQPSQELLEAMEEAEQLSNNPGARGYTFEEYQAAMRELVDEDD